jgi:6,7-dimethyl-8-ribityllumazine synthase
MADRPHLLIVEGRFYGAIADELAKGAVAALEQAGASFERVAVPGALEVPLAIRLAMEAGRERGFDGYVALGCVIRGQTAHFDIVANESARGLQELALRHGLAVGNGILTVESEDQAWARARLDGEDKGGQAAKAALALIGLRRRFGGTS